jgi:hypothetical protein
VATFGKTTDGGSQSTSSATRVWVSQATPSTTGIVTTGHARIWLSAAATIDTKFAIYADNGSGEPGALLAESDVLTLTATTEGERVFTFSGAAQITVSAGVPYWIGPAWQDPDPSGSAISVVVSWAGAAGGRREQALTWPTLPNPYGTPTSTTGSGPIDAYVTYTEITTETRRFYLTNSAAPSTPTDALSFWDDRTTGLAVRHLLGEAPAGASTSTAVATPMTEASWFVLLGQWVSHPASTSGTITGLYSIAAAWLESNAAADLNPVVTVWVASGIPINQTNAGRELPDGTAAGVQYTLTDSTPGSVNFAAGERIIVELGYRSMLTDGVSRTGTLYYGGTGSPPMSDGGTDLTDPGWVDLQITPGVTFVEPTGPSVAQKSGAFLGLI